MARSGTGALLVAIGLTLGPAAPATSEEPPRGRVEDSLRSGEERLHALEDSLSAEAARKAALEQQASAAATELADLAPRLVAAAQESAQLDDRLHGLEASLARLDAEQRPLADRLGADRERLAALLGALTRLSRLPVEALAGRPGAQVDAIRTALLLRSVVPELDRDARALAVRLQPLLTLRDRIAHEQQEVAKARAMLEARQQETAALVRERERLLAHTATEREALRQRMAELAANAADVKELIDRLNIERLARERTEQERAARDHQGLSGTQPPAGADRPPVTGGTATSPVPPPSRKPGAPPEPTPRALVATLPAPDGAVSPNRSRPIGPVSGPIATAYGQRDRFGAPSRGLHISAHPGATVVAPFSGAVRFAGAFRGYGQLLIVEHPDGYHSLIAGLGEINAAVGQRVIAGEPVGTMARDPEGDATLYYELRRNGRPINPRLDQTPTAGSG